MLHVFVRGQPVWPRIILVIKEARSGTMKLTQNAKENVSLVTSKGEVRSSLEPEFGLFFLGFLFQG